VPLLSFGIPFTLPWNTVSGAACGKLQWVFSKRTLRGRLILHSVCVSKNQTFGAISYVLPGGVPCFWLPCKALHAGLLPPDLQTGPSCWTASPWVYEVLNGIFWYVGTVSRSEAARNKYMPEPNRPRGDHEGWSLRNPISQLL